MGGIKRESEHAKVDASPTIRQTSEKTRVLNNLEPLEKLRFLAFFFFNPFISSFCPHWEETVSQSANC